MKYILTFAIAMCARYANAQDLKKLEKEVQTQIQVTQDLSQLVNKVIEQDQSEAVLKHYDYWMKKKTLVARVSAALAEYEAYLVHHMDPVKNLYARHNYIVNSDQYTPDQKDILVKDVIDELRKIINEKIQPEKSRAYTKLLSSISPYFPVIVKKGTDDSIESYLRAGEPTKVLKYNKYMNLDFSDLLLLDLLPGCYSKTCMKLYASDIVNLTIDFTDKIPSHVIVNIGNELDDKKYERSVREGRSYNTIEKIVYPKHVSSTVEWYNNDKSKWALGDQIVDSASKDLPYSLGEVEYRNNKERLESTLKSNLIITDREIGLRRTAVSILWGAVAVKGNQCNKESIDGKAIGEIIQRTCRISTIPGGEFCLDSRENVTTFSLESVKILTGAMVCNIYYGNERTELARKILLKTMEQVHKLKWPK